MLDLNQIAIKPYLNFLEYWIKNAYPLIHKLHEHLLILAAESQSWKHGQSAADHFEIFHGLLHIIEIEITKNLFY